nr:uncharacterized protein LOC112732354 isoform X2 [Arachis hypogaea]
MPLLVSRPSSPRSVSSLWYHRSTKSCIWAMQENFVLGFSLCSFPRNHLLYMGKPKLLEIRCSPCYITDLFKNLETNQAQAKLDEIEVINFCFLKLVPKWQVKQGIMVMLAKAYDIETSTLKLDNRNIRIGPELFSMFLVSRPMLTTSHRSMAGMLPMSP